MNGNLPQYPGDDGDDGGLDPGLIELFDAARANTSPGRRNVEVGPAAESGLVTGLAPTTADAFVTAVLLRIHGTRRLRLLRQVAGLAIVLLLTAFLAPYVATQTFLIADWFTNQLPATGMALLSSIGCLCGALFAWSVTRWARTY